MSTYTIGEVAERSGFSASALRYYEGVGLVAPVARTEAGYRIYDERSLDRLAFIARAKQLGCTLEDITDLTVLWDGERCGPVQQRLHDLVTTKIGDSQRQVNELDSFITQLRTATGQLSGPPVDGACGDACACLVDTAAPAAIEPPIVCSLDAGSLEGRLAEWRAVLALVRSRSTGDDGAVRLDFDEAVDIAELARLVAAEQTCCAFFAFAITVDTRGVALEVRAPAEAEDLVASLFSSEA